MTEETKAKQPTHRLYSVKGSDKNARWTEIGAAWANSDGLGFSIQIDAIPLDGRIVMRTPKAETGGAQ